MADDSRLSELSQKLGGAAAEIDFARHALEQYGSFSEPYADASDRFNDLIAVARAFLQARMELDVLMGTFPGNSRRYTTTA